MNRGARLTGFSVSLVGELDFLGDCGVLTTDSQLVVTGWNLWLERCFDRPPAEIHGRPLFDVFPDLVARKLDRQYGEALEGQTSILSQRLHGYVLPLRPDVAESQFKFMQQATRIIPLVDRGVICGTVTLIEDVTERVADEVKLRESEERFRLILGSATDYAIFTLNAARTVTSWSPGAEALFGVSAEQMLGRSGDMLFTPEDRKCGAPRQEARKALAAGRAADDRWHVRHDGSRFFASGVLTPLGEGARYGFVKVLRDLTDRKRVEDELRDAHDELERRVDERTADLAEAVERLKEEIRVRERAEATRTELQRRLLYAQEDERRRIGRDLHDTVGQLMIGLSLAAKAGKAEEVKRVSDELVRQVQELTTRLRPTQLDDCGLEAAAEQLVHEWSARTGVAAAFDAQAFGEARLPKETETALYRVVQEALTNVAKHAKATSVSVVLSVTGRSALVIVEDDGAGFDPETVGTGRLGLVGMKERIALAGGELHIEAAPDAGTTLIARIPVYRPPQSPVDQPADQNDRHADASATAAATGAIQEKAEPLLGVQRRNESRR
jgi:PAS domain S-box-containing protein